MKIGIMQPYLFSYIGYFQLLQAVDLFVIYDDVNFINRGWINRNKILVNGEEVIFTIPLKGASQNRLINEIELSQNSKQVGKILKTIEMAYKKAPYFDIIFQIVHETLTSKVNTISELAELSIKYVANYLDLKVEIKRSSESYHNQELKKADRLIDICKEEEMDHYINAVGGMAIYPKEYFKKRGININFLNPQIEPYKQFGNEFSPGLSIIDVLMFNSKEELHAKHLTNYILL